MISDKNDAYGLKSVWASPLYVATSKRASLAHYQGLRHISRPTMQPTEISHGSLGHRAQLRDFSRTLKFQQKDVFPASRITPVTGNSGVFSGRSELRHFRTVDARITIASQLSGLVSGAENRHSYHSFSNDWLEGLHVDFRTYIVFCSCSFDEGSSQWQHWQSFVAC